MKNMLKVSLLSVALFVASSLQCASKNELKKFEQLWTEYYDLDRERQTMDLMAETMGVDDAERRKELNKEIYEVLTKLITMAQENQEVAKIARKKGLQF